jgi:hypothetical protein
MAISDPGAIEVTQGEGVSLLDIARSLEPLIREHDHLSQVRRAQP